MSLTPWKQAQKALIIVALEQFGGNKTHAARYLGISLRTLRNKCIEFGLTKTPQKTGEPS